MASTAWVGLLALTCAVVLGAGTTEEPAAVETAISDVEGPKFQELPGTRAGSEIYKEVTVESMVECSGLCGGDDECNAYEYDPNFKQCKFMKTSVEKLERQTDQAEGKVLAKASKDATKEAGTLAKSEEKEKKKEEEDVEAVEETPEEDLVKKPTPRDLYRKAIKNEKEAKILVRDRNDAFKELGLKVKGANTVERIVKRHEQEIMVKFNQEHKSFSAATLNMEEQVMIRDDRDSKEVILARGAKEEAEVTFDKIHTTLLNTQRMLKKAEDMGAAQQKAEIEASQAFVRSKMQSGAAKTALKLAKANYAAAEIKAKDAADLEKQKQAGMAQTYLKMRNLIKERDARAAQGSVVDFKKADAETAKNCHESQEKMQEAEQKIKQELSEEIGGRERALAEKDIKRIQNESNENVNKENAEEEKKLVADAKAKADGNVADVMDVMSEDKMLGESNDPATAGAEAAKAISEAALDKSKTAVATANAAFDSAKVDSKSSDDVLASAKKALEGEKDEEKKKPLQVVFKTAEKDAKDSADKVAALSKARTAAGMEETSAKAAVEGAEADADGAKVAKKLQKGMEKKAVIEAEEKATMEGANAKMAAMSSFERKAHEIRKSTDRKIQVLIEAAWQKKKAELGFKDLNCDEPSANTEDRLRQRVKELELEKLRATGTAPAGDTLPAAAVKEIEQRVQATSKAEFQTELASAKKEMKEKMAAQLKNEKKIMDRDTKESQNEVQKAKQAEASAKGDAEASKVAAARAEKATPVAPAQTWGIMNKIRSLI